MAGTRPARAGRLARPAATAAEPAAGPAAPPRRPVLLVLAGVNGAGKSSIGGDVMLRRAGMPWYDPDRYTRRLVDAGLPLGEANARAWQHGVDLLDRAVAAGHSHAFETTLGGTTMVLRIAAAARSHDVMVWFCGLSSPEQHIARVAARVAAGGHDIPEAKIRERWLQAPLNLIALLPRLTELRVFDNSADVAPGQAVPDPALVVQLNSGTVAYPQALPDLARTPGWAKPIVKAARDLSRSA